MWNLSRHHVTVKAAAKASDEKNKLNKTKNTLGLSEFFIINFLVFLLKITIVLLMNLNDK